MTKKQNPWKTDEEFREEVQRTMKVILDSFVRWEIYKPAAAVAMSLMLQGLKTEGIGINMQQLLEDVIAETRTKQ